MQDSEGSEENAPGEWGRLEGATDEADAFATWLQEIVGHLTVRQLEETFFVVPGSSRTQWSRYFRAVRLPPEPLLEAVIKKLAPPSGTAQTGRTLYRLAEESETRTEAQQPAPPFEAPPAPEAEPTGEPSRSPRRVTTKRLGYAAAVAALALAAGSLAWIAPWDSAGTEPFTLDGTYRGNASNGDVAVATFHPGRIGESVGTIEWPGLSCTGDLQLSSVNGAEGVIREKITERSSSCLPWADLGFTITKGEVHLDWLKDERTAVLVPD
ncbi:hypothetical protein ACIBK8_25015 [Streptomyces sp. NPDC050161]|uniref:hypothetical protein n=1 Tax=Streptomyces sp. NPDC050161 TaxID=3365604 RepID=UPI0037AC5822